MVFTRRLRISALILAIIAIFPFAFKPEIEQVILNVTSETVPAEPSSDALRFWLIRSVAATDTVVYHIPAFGADSEAIGAHISNLRDLNKKDPLLAHVAHVVVDPVGECGYHFFTDSQLNGSMETAFMQKLIPAAEEQLKSKNMLRYITGGSSGAWVAMHIFLNHSDRFNGVWSIAPDPLDFRDFFGVNLYTDKNMYRASDGTQRLERRNSSRTLSQYIMLSEHSSKCDGDFQAYDRSFGAPLFNRESGEIDAKAVEQWQAFDLQRRLRSVQNAEQVLKDKIHLIVGEDDDYFLDQPTRLFCDSLTQLVPQSQCLFVPKRGHSNIYWPHPKLYPHGLLNFILDQIVRSSKRV